MTFGPLNHGRLGYVRTGVRMSKFNLIVAIGASLVAYLLPAAPAQALFAQTFVSGIGLDSNDCATPATACHTFDHAIASTANYGWVVCAGAVFDPPLITINKPIMIDCTASPANVLGITINVAAGAIRLRNLRLNGLLQIANGISILAAANVIIEDCVIENFTGFGINRSAGGRLLIRNTTIQNNSTGIGIFVGDTEIDNSRIDNNNNGIGVANTARVTVSRSVLSGHTSSALILDPGGIATVDGTTISSNSTGITAPAGATVVLSNNNIFLNTTAISGTTFSYRNNQIQIGGLGTPPTAVGSPQSLAGTM